MYWNSKVSSKKNLLYSELWIDEAMIYKKIPRTIYRQTKNWKNMNINLLAKSFLAQNFFFEMSSSFFLSHFQITMCINFFSSPSLNFTFTFLLFSFKRKCFWRAIFFLRNQAEKEGQYNKKIRHHLSCHVMLAIQFHFWQLPQHIGVWLVWNAFVYHTYNTAFN